MNERLVLLARDIQMAIIHDKAAYEKEIKTQQELTNSNEILVMKDGKSYRVIVEVA